MAPYGQELAFQWRERGTGGERTGLGFTASVSAKTPGVKLSRWATPAQGGQHTVQDNASRQPRLVQLRDAAAPCFTAAGHC